MLCAPRYRTPFMALAIFDLDNTLLGGDSDHAWGEFVCELGIVDPVAFGRRNDEFFRDYQAGELDIDAYLRHALSPLAGQDMTTVDGWHRQFMASKVQPMLLPAAEELLSRHRRAGDDLLIITATNRYITAPIAALLGVTDLLACEARIVNGRYTGEPTGVPSYAQGKVTRLQQWLGETGKSLQGSWFYSDSHNDLPLLRAVDHPVAVDPDDTLLAVAESAGWPIISLRDSP
jgi:HAD superfamily hydrolase (TIGR01490 family)